MMLLLLLMLLLMLLLLLGGAIYFLNVVKSPRCKSSAKLHGKTVIITGANTGIGKTTAMDLARRGARVILACRDSRRAEAAVQEIVQETKNKQVIFMQLDLASLKSVRSFADNFLRSESRLDLLINNAGLLNSGKTEDGFGMIFGVNHLGHFLLTVLLLDRLKASGPSRVVNLSSRAFEAGKVDLSFLRTHRDLASGSSDLQLLLTYGHSKLCNNLFTYELAKRLQGSDVTCYSVHPGYVKTEIGRNFSHWWTFLFRFAEIFSRDAVSGCQTTLHCALVQDIEHLSGHFFLDCAPMLNIVSKSRDDAVATKLWELSETFCGLS